MPTRRMTAEERFWEQERAEAEAQEERACLAFQAKRQEKMRLERMSAAPKQQRPEPPARTPPARIIPAASDPTQRMIDAIEDHHHSLGGYLKAVEAHLTHVRCTTYLNDPEVNKAFDGIIKGIQKARPVLDRRRSRGPGFSTGCRPGGDAYYGPELDALQKLAYVIETGRQIHQEHLRDDRKLDRVIPLDDPDERKWRRRQLADAERFVLPDEIRQELDVTAGAVLAAARRQPQLMPGNQPRVLNVGSAERPMRDCPALEGPAADRHAALRTALLENPDQPQAVFVSRCRVHPDTVRRCRRELEEAGAIPFLPHRHGPAQLAEAAD